MKILVTGASGFIGSHLVSALLRNPEHEVYTADRSVLSPLSSRHYPIQIDFGGEFILPGNLPKPDAVVHLAQSRHYREFPDKAKDIYMVNVNSTFQLIDWCKRNGVSKFIYASTGSVYKSSTAILKESDETEASNFYAASKLAAENLLRPYSDSISIAILRLFSPYGPGQKNMLIPNIIDKILSGGEIQLNQNKGLLLSPIYIDDCTEIISRLISSEIKKFEILNLGGLKETSLREIIDLIASQSGKKANVKIQEGNAVNIRCDSSRIYNLTKYQPLTTLQEGLKKCIL